jgi:hypothetical protein
LGARADLEDPVCYEGILDENRQEVARFMFILSGAAGHTYGANGIWQINTPPGPFGLSDYNSRTGEEHVIGEVTPDAAGAWQMPLLPTLAPWVLVLERKR